MNKFLVFISDNFLAVLVLLTLIFALIVYERRKGGTKVDNSEMTRLINKENPLPWAGEKWAPALQVSPLSLQNRHKNNNTIYTKRYGRWTPIGS